MLTCHDQMLILVITMRYHDVLYCDHAVHYWYCADQRPAAVIVHRDAGTVCRSVVFTSANHLLRYYCICHTCCSLMLVLVMHTAS